MQAVRNNRYVILQSDMEKGWRSQTKRSETEYSFYT